MRLGGWSILMLSCRGRTPPPQLQLPHTCGQRAGAVPAPAHLQLHLTAASSPAGQTILGSILIESQYPSYILKPSPISESPALLSVTPHFIPSSTQSPGTAHCHNILLFLHRKNPFCDFQSSPAHFPGTTNHKTQPKSLWSAQQIFYLHWSWSPIKREDCAKPSADTSHRFPTSQEAEDR